MDLIIILRVSIDYGRVLIIHTPEYFLLKLPINFPYVIFSLIEILEMEYYVYMCEWV